MEETNESIEAPKNSKTPAQLENVKKARAKKKEVDDARKEDRERQRAEKNFERLLDLFEKVRIEPPPEVPRPSVERPKPQAKVTAEPAKKKVFLRFY